MIRAIARVLHAETSDDYKKITKTVQPVLINSVASTVNLSCLIDLG